MCDHLQEQDEDAGRPSGDQARALRSGPAAGPAQVQGVLLGCWWRSGAQKPVPVCVERRSARWLCVCEVSGDVCSTRHTSPLLLAAEGPDSSRLCMVLLIVCCQAYAAGTLSPGPSSPLTIVWSAAWHALQVRAAPHLRAALLHLRVQARFVTSSAGVVRVSGSLSRPTCVARRPCACKSNLLEHHLEI